MRRGDDGGETGEVGGGQMACVLVSHVDYSEYKREATGGLSQECGTMA